MGVDRKVLSPGNGVDFPTKGSMVTMHYTGGTYDQAAGEAKHFMGAIFDSSKKPGRGPFATKIGVGRLIQGWDEGVPQMSLGEKSILTITPDFGYGPGGIPGVIPPNATLVFEVELLSINNKSI
ncbi:peptidyl-prolyl cis-trans isomerase [Aspergillus taichungensis]|uniref:peptidylprolyl isomerase n=1 Tax=Aspergillus taichungensis TaxID=482145 RepID=A0A2J5HI51_9EURO|nr:peptidyl-prolyl cis-trans isomerase [Aspergillus taichungensis]